MAEVKVTITGTLNLDDDDAKKLDKQEKAVIVLALMEMGKNVTVEVERIRADKEKTPKV